MARLVTANFLDNNGTPATGLSPTIRIRNIVTGELLVTDAIMTEVGDGGYYYNFVGYDSSIIYQVRCDGGSSLQNRYTFGDSPEDDTLALADVPDIKVVTDELGTMLQSNGLNYQFTIDALVNSPSGGGMSGSSPVSIVVNDGLLPIPDVSVQIWDLTMVNLLDSKTTDGSGQALFTANDGRYYIKLRKSGYDFSSSYPLTVNGSSGATLSGTYIANTQWTTI